ncbi:transcriptional regulator [Halalkalicoccus tibetensis]|uniref:Transcriptional regulator n=1 Tax=Halalkalicoccus tibetensis TaxID=175632 RepID=A0ABD5V7I0_9EURY
MKTDNGNETESDERVLHIRFKQSDSESVEAALAALDQGETPEPYLEVVFHDPVQLHQVTRPKNLELLQVITSEHPESIRETARIVERDVRQVHRNLNELESLGLIDLDTVGQSKRPTVWYDSISVDLSLDHPVNDRRGVKA